ncbi:hypothetical protein GCM10027569_66910 [Flindersiella endophytica]
MTHNHFAAVVVAFGQERTMNMMALENVIVELTDEEPDYRLGEQLLSWAPQTAEILAAWSSRSAETPSAGLNGQ